MRHRSEFLLMCLALGSLTALSHLAIAADWPNRSVTVIVPFGAGGNTDMMARLASQDLSAKFGQTFVVENRPSAGGALGTRAVASANPDGYTLEFAASSMVTSPSTKLGSATVMGLPPVRSTIMSTRYWGNA